MVASQHDFCEIRGHNVGLDKDNSCFGVAPKDKFAKPFQSDDSVQALPRKNKSLSIFPKSCHILIHPASTQRGVATVTGVGSGERWTRGVLLDEQDARGWRSRVVLASRC
jgi:hypothetical protein